MKAHATVENHYVESWTYSSDNKYTSGIVGSNYFITEPESYFPATSVLTITMGVQDTVTVANFDLNGYFLNIAAGEFATYYSDKNLTLLPFETDAAIYTVAQVSGDDMVLSNAIDVAPAGTPLIVYNGGTTAKTVMLTKSPTADTPVTYAYMFKGGHRHQQPHP